MSGFNSPIIAINSEWERRYPLSPERIVLDKSVILDHTGTPFQLRGFSYGHFDVVMPGSAAIIAGLGGNYARIMWRWLGFYGDEDVDSYDPNDAHYIDAANLALLDSYVDDCEAAGIWFSLGTDTNCGQNGTQSQDDRDYCALHPGYGDTDPADWPNGRNLWTDDEMFRRFLVMQQFLVNRFKNRRRFAFLEPLPEPNPPGVPQAQVTARILEMVYGCMAICPTISYMIGPTGGYDITNIVDSLVPFNLPLIYTGNLFWHTGQSQGQNINKQLKRLQAMLDMQDKYGVCTLINQYGIQSIDDPTNFYMPYGLKMLTDAHQPFAIWDLSDKKSNSPNSFGLYWWNHDHWEIKHPYDDECRAAFAAPY